MSTHTSWRRLHFWLKATQKILKKNIFKDKGTHQAVKKAHENEMHRRIKKGEKGATDPKMKNQKSKLTNNNNR